MFFYLFFILVIIFNFKEIIIIEKDGDFVIKKGIKFSFFCIFMFILVHVVIYGYCLFTPKIDINKAQSYYLYDNKNELLFNNSDEWIELEDISKDLINATIAVEDKHFYKHTGLDYLRIVKAMFNNIMNGKLSEGASTITQQYARNLFLNYDKTWKRKIDEAILAFELETHYSKNEILEGYLNTINYGGVYGIENASRYYFNKSASELNLSEASMLAGIPQSPKYNSPLVNVERANNRQSIVLSLMVNNDFISVVDKNGVLNDDLVYYGKINNDNNLTTLSYFEDAVINELNTITGIPKSVIDTGGLKIYTTLDTLAQSSLENAVKNSGISDSELQIGAIMTNPNNGEVTALIGGVDYNKSQFNRVISSKRQVGSTIKPFLYYTALESGFTSASSFTSSQTTFNFSNNKTYTPKNYNDTYANGPLSMGAAIAYSDNIYAVKTHLFLGENMLVNTANRLGVTSTLEEIPSLALGTNEISLIEMVNGYSSFANSGYKIDSHFIRKIEDSKGNVLYEYKNKEENILNSSLTFILSEMLTYTYDSDFIDYNYPTVISLLPKITNKYAIKTGTTDTDLWIMGYNKDAVLGIWTGYDDNRKLTSEDNSYHKNIWIETMESYFKEKETSWYDIPDNVVGVFVNPITGELVNDTNSDKKRKMFYFIKGTEPTSGGGYDFEAVFKEENE